MCDFLPISAFGTALELQQAMGPKAGTQTGTHDMFSKNKFQPIIAAAIGALVFSTASISTAVGPALPQVAALTPLASPADLAHV
jgi:hypothetical protein